MSNVETYFEILQKPWSKMMYDMVWWQLPLFTGKRILDFGSGFGITANHFASNNSVIAVEPDIEMYERSIKENSYNLINGSIEEIRSMPSESFDVIICNNVLEYIENKFEYIELFHKILKKGGTFAILKHNSIGRTMSRVVLQQNFKLALKELSGQIPQSESFGNVIEYDLKDVNEWADKLGFQMVDFCGIRIFWGLIQDNEIKYNPNWQKDILELEKKVCRIEEFRNIASFHHMIFEKK